MRIRIFGCTMAMSSRFPRNRPAKPEIRNPKFEIRSKSEDTNVLPLDGSLIAAAKTIEPQRHKNTEKLERKGERKILYSATAYRPCGPKFASGKKKRPDTYPVSCDDCDVITSLNRT